MDSTQYTGTETLSAAAEGGHLEEVKELLQRLCNRRQAAVARFQVNCIVHVYIHTYVTLMLCG